MTYQSHYNKNENYFFKSPFQETINHPPMWKIDVSALCDIYIYTNESSL
jgi:hypothetical protein